MDVDTQTELDTELDVDTQTELHKRMEWLEKDNKEAIMERSKANEGVASPMVADTQMDDIDKAKAEGKKAKAEGSKCDGDDEGEAQKVKRSKSAVFDIP